jgi:uncharacterized protein YciI
MYALIYKMIDIDKNVSNRPEHVDFLRRLLREGKIIAGWKFPEYEQGQLQGVLICKAGSKNEVESWFRQDPIISSGARTFEVRLAEEMAVKA